jgi:hypothetical protein
MNVHRPSSVTTMHPADIPPSRLWGGVLLAPAAWIAQGSLGWYFGYAACEAMTTAGARTALGVLSVVTLAVALTGLWIAWTNWGRTTSSRHVADIKGWDRVEFMSAGGVLVSGMFSIGIVWAGLSPILLDACGRMR